VRIAHALNDVAVAGGMVMATSAVGSGTVAAEGVSAGAPSSVHALPSTFCSPVYHASGVQPRYLIAADLPLQGPYGFEGAQMSQAIQVVLRTNEFRAGRFLLGLQVCDDQTASGDLAVDKCAANARAYAGDPSVIGVVGPLDSRCAHSEIPILNRAPHGPLGIVSPSNTYGGLTQGGPGSLPGEPESLYPTGRRNYIRIVAPDAVQGAANAELAQRLGVRRLFVVRDGEPDGNFLAATVRRDARRRGVAIAGYTTASLPVATLAGRIRRSGADGVFIGASLTPRAVAVLRAARRGVGPTGAILTPDGFFDERLDEQAGTAAEGLMVSMAGLPIQALGPAGQRFVQRFSANTGARPLAYSVYAAQAAQVLLDAIARSDGTRRSVTRELFATKVRGGMLGNFDITPTGDTTAGAVTIYRIHDGRRRLVTVIEPAP
jgi:branched-chain amino acid transport system substrate-binding protein